MAKKPVNTIIQNVNTAVIKYLFPVRTPAIQARTGRIAPVPRPLGPPGINRLSNLQNAIGFTWPGAGISLRATRWYLSLFSIFVLSETSTLRVPAQPGKSPILREATAFYHAVKDSLSTPNLVVDLRNNPGGGNRTSLLFYRLLKKHRGQIFVLVNFLTVSNAEQFTVKIKNGPNVTLLGDRTRGMLSYGHRYSESRVTPSGRFRVYFSDMKDHRKRYLPYEGRGIEPDFHLDGDRDWPRQVLEKTARQHPAIPGDTLR